MPYANYRQIEKALSGLQEFTGNSARASWDSEGFYTVYSYTTPIAKANARTGGVVLNGLKTRVEEEAQLFLYPKTSEIIYT